MQAFDWANMRNEIDGRDTLRRFGAALLVLALIAGVPARAQAPDLSRAEALMKQEKPAEAYSVLAPLEDQFAGNVDFDYLLGIAALDSGKADRATLAFERVLAVNPNFAGARLDMARAYFQLGDLDRAKAEFTTVRGQNPPAAALATISRYMDAIDAAEKARQRRFVGYIEGTVGRDTNVNNSTAQSQINVPALGNLLFTLNPTNVKTPDNFKALGGGGEYTYQVRPNVGLFVGGDARFRSNLTQDRFDTFNRDLRAGATLGPVTNQVRLAYLSGRYDLDNSLSRKAEGLSGEWRYTRDPANQFNVFSQYLRNRFADAAVQVNSFNSVTSGLGWLRVIGEGKAVLFGSYLFGDERDTNGRADGSKRFDGVRLGGQVMLKDNLDLFAATTNLRGHYDRQNATFLATRGDQQNDTVLGVNWRFARNWTLRPQWVESRNNSNIPIYAFKRTELSVSVRRDFR